MTDCGCLGHARTLPREVRPWALPPQLARWRAQASLDEGTAQALFGVGLETLSRIERGEIDPEPDLVERIWRQITAASHSAAEARPQAVSRASPLAREGRGAPTGEAGVLPGPPLCSAPTFALREPDGAPPFIEMTLAGDDFELSIDAADDMHGELLTLLALARSRL